MLRLTLLLLLASAASACNPSKRPVRPVGPKPGSPGSPGGTPGGSPGGSPGGAPATTTTTTTTAPPPPNICEVNGCTNPYRCDGAGACPAEGSLTPMPTLMPSADGTTCEYKVTCPTQAQYKRPAGGVWTQSGSAAGTFTCKPGNAWFIFSTIAIDGVRCV